ncbi:MAG: family transporter [Rhizobium sp.]|nr:family transporter [Rhizobium sp.]
MGGIFVAVETTDAAAGSSQRVRNSRIATNRYLGGIFILLSIYGLFLGRDFLTPVLLAFMLATTLSPIVRYLAKWYVPPVVSATLLIIMSVFVFGVIGYATSGPVSQMVSQAPEIGAKLKERVATIRQAIDKAVEATSQIDNVAENVSDGKTQKVVIAQPGILSRAAGNLLSVGTTMAITFVLSLFLLASGTMFYQKIIQSFSLLSDKKKALRVVYNVEREISRYLFTITFINIIVGIVVGCGLWVIGIPNAFVWGVAATVLNFLPYVGALIAIVLTGIISLVTFDNLAYSMLAPAFILLVHIMEGQFLTPLLLGRRLELNAVAVFISISFWSWLWGFVGALMAVPLLVVIKVVCDNFDNLKPFGNFLSAHQPPIKVEAEEPAPATSPVTNIS